MKDRKTGLPRGFGFVTYAEPSVVDKVIEDTHIINGKQVRISFSLNVKLIVLFPYCCPVDTALVIDLRYCSLACQVEIKRTIPKGAAGSKDFKTRKIFVGGIPSTVSEGDTNLFSSFNV